MKFVLFRHAHKGIVPFEDPELSLQGFEQAALILDLIKKENLPKPTHLYTSPKRRTSQTFYPTSKEFNLKIEVQPDLDQQNPQEANLDFKKRVQRFLEKIENTQELDSIIYACTHYDWIEESMTLISCDKDLNLFEFSHWSPTQHIVLELEKNHWKLLKKGTAK